MSDKPWANEDAPKTHRSICRSGGLWNEPLRDDMANIERRMRAAERLLEDVTFTFRGVNMPLVKAHLEAARKEDG